MNSSFYDHMLGYRSKKVLAARKAAVTARVPTCVANFAAFKANCSGFLRASFVPRLRAVFCMARLMALREASPLM